MESLKDENHDSVSATAEKQEEDNFSHASGVEVQTAEVGLTGDCDAVSGNNTIISSVCSKNSVNTYQVRPSVGERFQPVAVNELIHEVLHEELTGKTYSLQESEELTTKIATVIRNRVKEMAVNRYKYMVQVVLAEQRGAGIVMGMRCLWDAETDSYASNQFLSDTIYGMAVVFAVYFY